MDSYRKNRSSSGWFAGTALRTLSAVQAARSVISQNSVNEQCQRRRPRGGAPPRTANGDTARGPAGAWASEDLVQRLCRDLNVLAEIYRKLLLEVVDDKIKQVLFLYLAI